MEYDWTGIKSRNRARLKLASYLLVTSMVGSMLIAGNPLSDDDSPPPQWLSFADR